ncbi:MAG: hypothetical protein ABI222_17950 [Opitutaceae bacterium]
MNGGTGPVKLLQNVASALLGPTNCDDGPMTAELGLLMHFTVAYTMTTILYLLHQPVRSEIICGALVFFKYRLVLPLTIELKSI